MNITIDDKKKKDLFISTFQLLKNSSTHINASFNVDNVHIQGMDKSLVCLFDLYLKKAWFNEYIVNEKTELCFDSNIFYSMISTKGDDQKLVIKKLDEESLIIELVNGNKKSEILKFASLEISKSDSLF